MTDTPQTAPALTPDGQTIDRELCEMVWKEISAPLEKPTLADYVRRVALLASVYGHRRGQRCAGATAESLCLEASLMYAAEYTGSGFDDETVAAHAPSLGITAEDVAMLREIAEEYCDIGPIAEKVAALLPPTP